MSVCNEYASITITICKWVISNSWCNTSVAVANVRCVTQLCAVSVDAQHTSTLYLITAAASQCVQCLHHLSQHHRWCNQCSINNRSSWRLYMSAPLEHWPCSTQTRQGSPNECSSRIFNEPDVQQIVSMHWRISGNRWLQYCIHIPLMRHAYSNLAQLH